jgi:hypothetical protein
MYLGLHQYPTPIHQAYPAVFLAQAGECHSRTVLSLSGSILNPVP